jgi:chaperonin GroEL
LDRHSRGVELREGLLEHRACALEIAARLTRKARCMRRFSKCAGTAYLSGEEQRLFRGSERTGVAARVEDALHATRAAVEEGIVPGGGVAFIRAQKALDNIKDLEGDEQVGVQIVRRAIEEPMRQLADNAGQEGALIVQEVKKRKGNEGYNVTSGEYTDLVKAGIVDPTKVTRSALQNAASISGLLLTTEAIVTELPEKEKGGGMPPGGMGGGMGGMGGMDY